jgi:SpoVK/Ycf46/Vps4 family AAA+-type ATPase
MGPLRSLGEALLTTKREEIRPIDFDDFVTSLRKIRPSVSKESLRAFEKWNDEFGSKG